MYSWVIWSFILASWDFFTDIHSSCTSLYFPQQWVKVFFSHTVSSFNSWLLWWSLPFWMEQDDIFVVATDNKHFLNYLFPFFFLHFIYSHIYLFILLSPIASQPQFTLLQLLSGHPYHLPFPLVPLFLLCFPSEKSMSPTQSTKHGISSSNMSGYILSCQGWKRQSSWKKMDPAADK